MILTNDDIERFLALIRIEDGCWIFGSRDHYGTFNPTNQKTYKASRVAYYIFNGYLDDKLHVLHTCDVQGCIDPDHIFQGTHLLNHIDKTMKGRGNVARLKPQQVVCIRKLSKCFMGKTLAKTFNVSKSHVSEIINNNAWGWLNAL
jgi:hypothetical protein